MKLANLEKAYELAPEFKGKMKILMDTRGPEIRTGTFEVYNSKKELKAGQERPISSAFKQFQAILEPFRGLLGTSRGFQAGHGLLCEGR